MRIAILRTGLMGSALAEAVIGAGHDTVVYNRTMSRTAPLVTLGARAVATPAEAIAEADVTIVVAINGDAARQMLLAGPDRPALRGRKILNMTTTTPSEILALARDVATEGGMLAEASVTVYPDDVRARQGHFVLGCDTADELFWSSLLSGIGSYVHRAGAVGDASAADMPLIATYVLKIVTVAYAAAMARALKIPPGLIEHQLTHNPTLAITGAEDLFPQMLSGSYSESMASIDTVASAIGATLESVRSLGLPTAIFEQAQLLFEAASKRGLGGKDVAALYEVLANGSRV